MERTFVVTIKNTDIECDEIQNEIIGLKDVEDHFQIEFNSLSDDKNNVRRFLKSMNKTYKFACLVILIYFIFLWYGTIKGNQYVCILAAFIALFASLLFGPIKYFDKDIKTGIIISFLISLGVGIFTGSIYLDMNEIKTGILNESNIGNVITTLSLTILLLEKVYTLFAKS